MAMDPSNGHVSVHDRRTGFRRQPFQPREQAKRQSGSAFKPFVYAAALEAGYSPASLITGLNDPILTVKGAWLPEDDHSTGDEMTMRAALRTSSNRAAVQMLASVGIPKAVDYAEKLNVGKPPAVPSLALGASDVTLASLTAAYGAFADGGIVRTPILVRRVEDSDGVVLYKEEDKSHRAVSEATAFLMASMLADVINAGTAYRARQSGFVLPAAGKTGTTNDYNDAWFVGFTPHLVTGVWVGFDQPKSIASGGYAGELAVPIWGAFMKRATRGDKPDWFERPANVVGLNVCRMSGKLPTGGCDHVAVVNRDGQIEKRSMVYTEYFVRGTQPAEILSAPQSVVHGSSGRHFRQGRGRSRLGRGCWVAAGRSHIGRACHTDGRLCRCLARDPRWRSPRRSAVSGPVSSGARDDEKKKDEERKKEEERKKADERRS